MACSVVTFCQHFTRALLVGCRICKCYWTKSVDFVIVIYHIFPHLGTDLLIAKSGVFKSLTVAVDFSIWGIISALFMFRLLNAYFWKV